MIIAYLRNISALLSEVREGDIILHIKEEREIAKQISAFDQNYSEKHFHQHVSLNHHYH